MNRNRSNINNRNLILKSILIEMYDDPNIWQYLLSPQHEQCPWKHISYDVHMDLPTNRIRNTVIHSSNIKYIYNI